MERNGFCSSIVQKSALWLVIPAAAILGLVLVQLFGGLAFGLTAEFPEQYGVIDRKGYLLLLLIRSGIIILPAGLLLLAGILKLRNPAKDAFSKSVMKQTAYPRTTTLKQAFAQIDKDMESNRIAYDISKAYIGKEWMIARSGLIKSAAFRLENVRGIFLRATYGKHNKYYMYLMESDFSVTGYYFSSKSEWEQCYDLLCFRYPHVMCGDWYDYLESISSSTEKSQNQMRAVNNELAEKSFKRKSAFIFYPARGNATSYFSAVDVEGEVDRLDDDGQIRLQSLVEIVTNQGTCHEMECRKQAGTDRYGLIFMVNKPGNQKYAFHMEVSGSEAKKILRDFYNDRRVPDLSAIPGKRCYEKHHKATYQKQDGKIKIHI